MPGLIQPGEVTRYPGKSRDLVPYRAIA